jgi:tRNA pseudouridine55 synthase
VGTIQQLPPIYSAKKVGGERMYAAARRGEEVERTPVTVTVYAIRLTRFDLPDVEFEVECGAGTYIRAIARDAGAAVGVGGHLRTLRRTRVGPHSVDGAVPLHDLGDAERVAAAMLAPMQALAHMPRIVVDEPGIALLRHGRAIPASPDAPAGVAIALASAEGELLAIGERAGGQVRPRKVFIPTP